jgi:hypothetical protein
MIDFHCNDKEAKDLKMQNSIRFVILLNLIILLLTGCSGKSTDPVQPIVLPDNESGTPITLESENPADSLPEIEIAKVDEDQTNRRLHGMWTAEFNLESNKVIIEPYRETYNHYNVTQMIPAPSITINSYDTIKKILDVDVKITNPYPVVVYDLRLIIYTDNIGHLLKNQDSWTSLYDIPGGFLYNPFKAYAKDQANRKFTGNSTQHTENLKIYCPGDNFTIRFAVDASYPGNCEEPYSIENFIQTGNLQPSANIKVDVKDWQNDVNKVNLFAAEITGVSSVSLSHYSGNTWSADINNSTGAPPGTYYPVIIEAKSVNSSTLGLYDLVSLIVGDPCNPDNDPPDTAITSGCIDKSAGTIQVTLGVSGSDPNNCTSSVNLKFSWRNRKNSGTWSSWSSYASGSTITMNGLSAGDWDVEVKARDLSLNVDPTPATCSFNIDFDPCSPDNDPPDTAITSGCYDRTAGTTQVTLGVSGSDPNNCTSSANLQFSWKNRKNSGTWSSWSSYASGSTITMNGLSAGDWDVEVRARDSNLNADSTPAACHFNIAELTRLITMVSPNGGERLYVNDLYEITWSSENITGDVVLEYSIGSGWLFIGWFANTGSHYWQVPDLTTETAKIRITSVSYGISDESDNFFEITEPEFYKTWGGSYIDNTWAMDTDVNSNVYLAGFTRSYGVGEVDVLLIKYDNGGNIMWKRTWGGAGDEKAFVVKVEENAGMDYLYLAGSTGSFGSSDKSFLLKFDEAGNFIWARTWNGPQFENAQSLGIDLNGNVWVSTVTQDITGYSQVLILKYSSSGSLLSSKYWTGSTEFRAEPRTEKIQFDSSNNAYLSGTIKTEPGQPAEDEDIFIVKVDNSINLLWNRVWKGPGRDVGESVALDSYSNVYLGGYQSSYSMGERDALLMKLDSSGNRLWTRCWGTSCKEYLREIQIASDGHVRCIGSIENTTNIAQMLVISFRNDGSGLSETPRTWGTYPTNGINYGSNISVKPTGTTMFVSGCGSTYYGNWSTQDGSFYTLGSGSFFTLSGTYFQSISLSPSSVTGQTTSPGGYTNGGGDLDILLIKTKI